jgi:predicted metal-dependent hydrolase
MSSVIEYEIKRYRRSKYVRISVKPGGRVVVTTPWRTPQYMVRQFVAKQQEWIAKARAKMATVAPPQRSGSKQEYTKYKKEAHALFSERLTQLNQAYRFPYKRVSIRNQKTRWGSCSKSGTLSFSYRLLFVQPEVRDYVLVHELCHTKEMNHSRRFWELVSQTVPDYKMLRRQLLLASSGSVEGQL